MDYDMDYEQGTEIGSGEVSFSISSDSKFRRETSGLKFDFYTTEEAYDPPLLKQLPTGMKPEEFLGMVVNVVVSDPGYNTTFVIGMVSITNGIYSLNRYDPEDNTYLYYNPANGKLSYGQPIIEIEASDGDDIIEFPGGATHPGSQPIT